MYRRYRPDTFAEVIGQEHVTEPLMAALGRQRVNHAYLFSGPRGCGKTTSARILARCLNCENGPVAVPCGVCRSCQDLATGGPGSLDVVEIDAASHNGVDDARDIRDRAVFAPARDRYKIFILDEAHMVTTQGFNALLKLVEEPPEHVKFVFATTEPDKVIGTIRSRTHHYPFRLVPPERLTDYLAELCDREGVVVGKGVLPLVVRAGGGSVRDSLSVLDQLMAGAGEDGVDYERAVALLGYTHASLLDDVADAFAVGDGATVFRVVDRVIESGHDPRRFVEDLLERFRDLIVIAADPDGAGGILRATPADQLERMRIQARNFGAGELSRSADVVNAGLTEMTGATSPRLQLELICARVLLPGADEAERGTRARVDRLERRFGLTPGDQSMTPPTGRAQPEPAARAQDRVTREPVASQAAAPAAPVDSPAQAAQPTVDWPEPAEPDPVEPGPAEPEPADDVPIDAESAASVRSSRGPASSEPAASELGTPEPAGPAPAGPASGGIGPDSQRAGAPAEVETLRRAWPDVLDRLARIRRGSWALVSQNAQIHDLTDGVLTLQFPTQGLADAFSRGQYASHVTEAISQAIGIPCTIRSEAAGGAAGSGPKGGNPAGGRPDASGIDWPDIGPPIPSGSAPAGRPAVAERYDAPRPAGDSPVDNAMPPADGAGPPPDWAVGPAPGSDPGVDPVQTVESNPVAGHTPSDPTPATYDEWVPPDDGPEHDGEPTARSGTGGSNVVYPEFGRADDTGPADPPAGPNPDRPAASAPGRAGDTTDEASDDDPDQDDSGLFGAAVVEKILGGVVIDEVEE
nr:DNA polymerase III subunit gamma and tau [Spelaeicoccus albus]